VGLGQIRRKEEGRTRLAISKISTSDLELYGFCSLRWKYLSLGLPFRELSPEEAFYKSVREGLSRLLYGLARQTPVKAKARALNTFEGLWEASQANMGWDEDLVTSLTLEGHLALQQFEGWIGADDTVAGGKLPVEISVGEDLIVTGELDGLIMRRDDKSSRTCGILHVTNERSPLGSPRYQPLRLGFAQAVARRELLDQGLPVEHILFSPFTGVPKVRGAYPRKGWSAVVRNMANGIRHGVVFQTPHVTRCHVCFFKEICSSTHCGLVQEDEVETLRGTLNVRVQQP
jgi:hypothetical protein